MNTDWSNKCRICLKSIENIPRVNIFDDNFQGVLVRFERLIGTKIDPGTRLPTKICIQCESHIKKVLIDVDQWSQIQSYLHNPHEENNDATLVAPTPNQLPNPSTSGVRTLANPQFWAARNLVINTNGTIQTDSQIMKEFENTCIMCTEVFSQTSELLEHEKDHEEYQISCKYCEEGYENIQKLRQHMASSMCKIRNPCVLALNDRICIICEESFNLATTRVSHETHHEEYYISCKKCKKSFRSVHHLRLHVSSFG